MTQWDAPVDLDAQASAAFNDAIMAAISATANDLAASGKVLTLNALVGSLCAVAAYYVAGIDDARARKAMLREIEKQLPRLVAHQRSLEGAKSSVVTVYRGDKLN